jgi:hypothetical protein
MKHLFTAILLLIMHPITAQVLWNQDTTDNSLVNLYGEELKRLRIKHKIPKIEGFIKSVNLVNGSLMETIIVNYKDKDGESMQDMVSTRIISYKEIPKKDTAQAFGRDSIAITNVKEIKSFDSITFESKKITKFNAGYLVVGDINDGGVKIPIALSNFNLKDTLKKPQAADYKRFSQFGQTIFNNGKAVGSLFYPISGDTVYLVKFFEGTPSDWTGNQMDRCYTEKYYVPITWWNSDKNRLTFEEQKQYLINNF